MSAAGYRPERSRICFACSSSVAAIEPGSASGSRSAAKASSKPVARFACATGLGRDASSPSICRGWGSPSIRPFAGSRRTICRRRRGFRQLPRCASIGSVTSAPSGATPAKSPEGPRWRRPQPWWLTFLVVLAANWALMRAFAPEQTYVDIPYTLFKQQVQADNVAEVTSQGAAIQGTFKKELAYPSDGPNSRSALRFKTLLPAFANPGLETLLEEKGVVINARPLEEGRPLWQNLLIGFGPTLLLIAAFVWLNQRMTASGRGLFGLGRSGAKRYAEAEPKVPLDDVAGH